jgi:hypothetical protein
MVPFRQNLALHSLTPIWFPVYVILEPLVGQLRATNAILWIGVVLTGWTTYLFLRQQTIHTSLALLGGVILMLSPNMRGQLLGTHLDLIGFFWMPILLLLWSRVAKIGTGIGWPILVGFALWGAWLTDPVVNLWNALLLGPCALLTLIQAENRRRACDWLRCTGHRDYVMLAWFIGPLRPLLKVDMSAFAPYYQTARICTSPKVWNWQYQTGEPRGFGILFAYAMMALFIRAKDRRRWFWLAGCLLLIRSDRISPSRNDFRCRSGGCTADGWAVSRPGAICSDGNLRADCLPGKHTPSAPSGVARAAGGRGHAGLPGRYTHLYPTGNEISPAAVPILYDDAARKGRLCGVGSPDQSCQWYVYPGLAVDAELAP